MSDESFENGKSFARSFVKNFIDVVSEKQKEAVSNTIKELSEAEISGGLNLESLFVHLSKVCGKASKHVVLMIDEVDSASNNQVFIDFLGMLRGY